MKRKTETAGIVGVLFLAALLAACGDDVTNVTNETGARTAASLKDAGECKAGDLVVTLDDAVLHVCGEDGKWIAAKGEKGDPGDPGERGAKGDSGAVGAQGGQGAKGDSGAAGASCSGRTIEGVGVEISCGGAVVDTLLHGGNGTNVCGALAYDDSEFLCDHRDNRIYRYVVVGTQTWMAENLNFGEMVPGSGDQGDATVNSAQKYCWNDSAEYCGTDGGLYQWHTAMALSAANDAAETPAIAEPHRGICPRGWHIPTDGEWSALRAFVDAGNDGEEDDEARSLKSSTAWEGTELGAGSDDWEFNALPVGDRYHYNKTFQNRGKETVWWSSSVQNSNSTALAHRLLGHYKFLGVHGFERTSGLSVRCVKD